MPQQLTRALTLAMSVAAGLAVANIYYSQPILGLMIAAFAPSHAIRLVPALTQFGYALGLLLLVPLGDGVDRRRLILAQSGLLLAGLALTALAPTAFLLLCASVLVGIAATVAQQIIPFAAELSAPEHRGRSVGLVMSGLLTGILLARTLSGAVGSSFGWRAMFGLGAALVVAMAVLLAMSLPHRPPAKRTPYGALLLSLGTLARSQPALRRAIMIQGGLFGAFNIFWTTLALFLQGPAFHLGPEVAGLFGVVGVIGVLLAPWAGKQADRRGPEGVIGLGIWLVIGAFALFALAPNLAGLVGGVILLDAGVQMAMISNQSVIFALVPEARNRINTIYMTGMFLAGSIGSAAAGVAWVDFGWPAVCVLGLVFSLISLAAARFLPGHPAKRETDKANIP